MQRELSDTGAERALLGAIIGGGADALVEVIDVVDSSDFTIGINQQLYAILKHLAFDKDTKVFDIPTVLTGATSLGFSQFNEKGKATSYLEGVVPHAVGSDNLRHMASIVAKLSVARRAKQCVEGIKESLVKIRGTEPIADILSLLEDPLFAFTSKLSAEQEQAFILLARDYTETMNELASAKKDIVGLPTGFPQWDHAIGGGIRRGSVNLIGARPKNGKSFLCLNQAYNIGNANVPVLYLDTELPRKYQLMRLTSLVTKVELGRVETGRFSEIDAESNGIREAEAHIKSLRITHCNIAGLSVKAVLSIVRRWLVKHVGFYDNGETKPCVIIYDYLKLMDKEDIKSNMAEHQVMGFLMTELHNFALRYMVPFIVSCQLNRDGAERDTSEVFAGSDRLLWLCSSATLLKKKSSEELAEDPPCNGNRKLIVTDTRFGAGMEPGTYLNVLADFSRASLREGPMFVQSLSGVVPKIGKKHKKKANGSGSD